MVDLDRVIARLLSSGAAAGAAGGLVAAALTSKAGRKVGNSALKMGGVAAVAALAYAAYERHRRGRDVPLAGGPSLAFLPPAADPEPRRALGMALVRTMIAAARADGKLDARETRSVSAAIQRLDLDADEKALVLDELGRSTSLDEIVASARTPEQAAELYTAALLAIEVDTDEERAWLAELAGRLELPLDLVAEIHTRVDDASPAQGVAAPVPKVPVAAA